MRRISVLEDDADLRSLLREMAGLIGAECRVSVGTLGELREHESEVLSCDLVILDVNLGPGMPSGVDAYNWLRERRFQGDIAFLTGHARSHPLVQQAIRVKGVSVLQKPVDFGAVEDLMLGGPR